MRLVPLGQTDGQQVQTSLKQNVLMVASEVKDVTLDDLFSNTFMSDIMAMRHETQYSRIFQT
jgi:urease accessory protein